MGRSLGVRIESFAIPTGLHHVSIDEDHQTIIKRINKRRVTLSGSTR